jgi:alpha-glucosidase
VADGGQITRIDDQGIVRHEWHDGQFMVKEYLHSVTEAAKRGISINTHEPIKDTGLRRTYPNWIAREGARGQEYNAWGTPPKTLSIPPYYLLLACLQARWISPRDF